MIGLLRLRLRLYSIMPTYAATGKTVGECYQCGCRWTRKTALRRRVYYWYCKFMEYEMSFCTKWCFEKYTEGEKREHPKGYAVCKGCEAVIAFPYQHGWSDRNGWRCDKCQSKEKE